MSDRCCARCKVPYGWCAARGDCKCHQPKHDEGGILNPGPTIVTNNTGRPEVVTPLFKEPEHGAS